MRRALLIGSQTYGLKGVENDLKLMNRALTQLAFDVVLCKGVQASRLGIIQAWRDLIQIAQADDALVIYYAGHGGRVLNPDWAPGSDEPRHLSFLVPTDLAESSETDFRGILNLELGLLLTELTTKCINVTVLLDCCHAARLVRGARGRARALGDDWSVGIAGHLHELKAKQRGALNVLQDNPHAVRLTAAGPHQSAFEDPDETLGGYFTEVLAEALTQAVATPVSWQTLGHWVREQVLVMEPRQRPELEGPTERMLFQVGGSAQRRPADGSVSGKAGLTFFFDGPEANWPSLRGGHLHGVVVGNRYAIMDLEDAGEAEKRIATVEVTQVLGAVSRVTLKGDQPRDGSPALPLRELFEKRVVRVQRPAPEWLLNALNRSPLFTVTRPGTRAQLAGIRGENEGLVIEDERGRPLTKPTRARDALLADLESMARALTLRELREDLGTTLKPSFEIEWGKVLPDGAALALADFGEVLYPGEPIYVRITNKSQANLYVNLFDIGVSRRVTLLNHASRSGYLLQSEESWCFGYRSLGGLQGIPLSWPSQVPATAARLETLVAIVADQPMDLSMLATGSVSQRSGAAKTNLENWLASRCMGGVRSHVCQAETDVHYAIRQINFELSPR